MSALFEVFHWDMLECLGGDPMASAVGRSWQRYHVYPSFYQTFYEVLAPAGMSVCWRFVEKCYYCYSVCIQLG